MATQPTLYPAEPSLRDVLTQLKTEIFLGLNCHAIATVTKFDSEKQTVDAQINYKRTYQVFNKQTGNYDQKLEDYPQLIDCPAIFLGGGSGALTFPVEADDECLILFNDRDMDNWFQGGNSSGVATQRLHSFSDGIAIVGLRSLGNVLENFDSERAVLRKGQALVGVGKNDLVKVANNLYTLNQLLQELVTDVKNLITTNAVVGAPCTVSPATQAILTSTANKIAGLLE